MATLCVSGHRIMSYEFRYYFDPGSGVCLWSENDEAKNLHGYPVEHWELPLSENTKRYIQYLIAWFDTSIDWSYPSDSDDYWSAEETANFKEASKKGLSMLKAELTIRGYEIRDETGA